MNTCAGAPLSICLASAELAPYEIVGFAGDMAATSSSAFFRLAAANTIGCCACAAPANARKERSARKRRVIRCEPVRRVERYARRNIATAEVAGKSGWEDKNQDTRSDSRIVAAAHHRRCNAISELRENSSHPA